MMNENDKNRLCATGGFLMACIVVMSLGCPPGTKTSVDFTVKVSADLCKENKESPDSTAQQAALDCQVEAGTSVRVLFPRREWGQMKFHDPKADPGPGK